MRLRPEQLSQALQPLLPVYLVSGDEPLLVQELCDAIRHSAREQGCTEREVLQVDARFKWDTLLQSSAEMSLFADRKLIELRLPTGKPGTPGSKGLQAYLKDASPDNILLIVAGKVDKQSTNSKWFKAIDKAGAVIQVWPVDAGQMPRWLKQRLQATGLAIDTDALQVLCDRVEGNLLAAVQEVDKLRLLVTGDRVTLENVNDSVADNARYNLFTMVDDTLRGGTARALQMLHGLRSEGTEPAVVLWALAREIRLLCQCKADIGRGQPMDRVLQSHRVWDKRKAMVSAALSRHPLAALENLLQQAAATDQCIKGMADGNPWDHLSQLLMDLSRSSVSANSAPWC